MSIIKVLLVGRQPLSLAGLEALIGREPTLEVIGQWLKPTDLVTSLTSDSVDVALIDHGDDEDLDPLTAMVSAIDDGPRIILLTGSTNPAVLSGAFRCGVRGFVSKRQEPQALIRAIHTVHGGDIALDSALTTTLITSLLHHEEQPRPSGPPLRQRDHQIIALVGEGLANDQVARALHVSASTVRNRLTAISKRLGVSGRLQLIVYACQHGFVNLPRTTQDPSTRRLRLV